MVVVDFTSSTVRAKHKTVNAVTFDEHLFQCSLFDVTLNSVCSYVGGGLGSSVGIATGYVAGWFGERTPVVGEIFRICPHRSWGLPSLLYKAYRLFLGDKERPGRDPDPSPPSSVVVKKE